MIIILDKKRHSVFYKTINGCRIVFCIKYNYHCFSVDNLIINDNVFVGKEPIKNYVVYVWSEFIIVTSNDISILNQFTGKNLDGIFIPVPDDSSAFPYNNQHPNSFDNLNDAIEYAKKIALLPGFENPFGAGRFVISAIKDKHESV
jgi:hypothetical protein